MSQPFKRNKYGARKTMMDGVQHASKKQGLRWVLLRQWERDGKISLLRREVRYPLLVNGQKVCTYIADHVYREADQEIVEDVKGVKTPIYRLKKKLMKAVHDIEIREV